MTNPLTLSEIRSALFDTLVAGYTPNLATEPTIQIYRVASGLTITPCIVIGEITCDFAVSMGKGTDTYTAILYAVVPPDLTESWDLLDNLIGGAGTSSIRSVIFNANTLGKDGQLSAALLKWDDAGGIMEVAGTPCLAARGEVIIAANGRVLP